MTGSSSVVHIPETIFAHTLFQEWSTFGAGSGIYEPCNRLICFTVLVIGRDTHHIQIGITQLGYVSQFLDDVLLGMDAVTRITGSARPRAIPIRGRGQDLATLHYDGNV